MAYTLSVTTDVIKMIIENKMAIDLDHVLQQSVQNGDVQMCQYVLERGADANAIINRIPALHYACKHNYVEIAKLLVEHGARVNKIKNGCTPLTLTHIDDPELFCFLVHHGADLHYKYGDTSIYETMLENKDDPTVKRLFDQLKL